MIKFFKQKNIEKGFTLVETLVAVSIFSLSIVALLSILGQGISDTGYAKKKIIAGYLAQEGIESIRNMRDDYILYNDDIYTWTTFKFKFTSNGCVNNKCTFDNSKNPTLEDSEYISSCTTCKLYLNNNGGYDIYATGVDSGFSRYFKVKSQSSNEIKILSTVTWTQGSGLFSITLEENLFNWVE